MPFCLKEISEWISWVTLYALWSSKSMLQPWLPRLSIKRWATAFDMTLWGVVLGVIGGLSGLTEGRPVYSLAAAGELMGMVADQLSQYPEGQALVRDVLGLPDPTTVPPPTTTKRTFQDPPRDSGSDVVIPEPSISSSNHGKGRRPSSVSVTPTQGRLSLHPVGIVYRRSQMGFIRIRVDISSLHRQIQEVQHHFQESGYPSAQETSDGNSCIDDEGSFVSLHQALLAGAGAPVIGEFNGRTYFCTTRFVLVQNPFIRHPYKNNFLFYICTIFVRKKIHVRSLK